MNKVFLFITLCSMTLLSSCVTQDVKTDCNVNVTLEVKCDSEWLQDYQMEYTRASDIGMVYKFEIFKAGDTTQPVKEFNYITDTPVASSFSTTLELLPGEYDIYVWADVCNLSDQKSLFFNDMDFTSISCILPYEANTDNKVAFRGNASIKISYTTNSVSQTITLERPQARYIVIAENFNETGITATELEAYTVKVSYPLFLPFKFNNFTNKDFDSQTGISYTGNLVMLSDNTAQLALDYVFVNEGEGGVEISLSILDSNGNIAGDTGTFSIPLQRNRTTIVSGQFFTTKGNGDVTINPDFDGQHNIEIK